MRIEPCNLKGSYCNSAYAKLRTHNSLQVVCCRKFVSNRQLPRRMRHAAATASHTHLAACADCCCRVCVPACNQQCPCYCQPRKPCQVSSCWPLCCCCCCCSLAACCCLALQSRRVTKAAVSSRFENKRHKNPTNACNCERTAAFRVTLCGESGCAMRNGDQLIAAASSNGLRCAAAGSGPKWTHSAAALPLADLTQLCSAANVSARARFNLQLQQA
jgi:hypothetical protein